MACCTIVSSVPQKTSASVTVTSMAPGRLGSSKRSVCRMRRPGTSSRYSPPNEWLRPVVKFLNDILNVPPTLASRRSTLHVNPCGGSHLTTASGSRKARYTRSGFDLRTRWRRTVRSVMHSPRIP